MFKCHYQFVQLYFFVEVRIKISNIMNSGSSCSAYIRIAWNILIPISLFSLYPIQGEPNSIYRFFCLHIVYILYLE